MFKGQESFIFNLVYNFSWSLKSTNWTELKAKNNDLHRPDIRVDGSMWEKQRCKMWKVEQDGHMQWGKANVVLDLGC